MNIEQPIPFRKERSPITLNDLYGNVSLKNGQHTQPTGKVGGNANIYDTNLDFSIANYNQHRKSAFDMDNAIYEMMLKQDIQDNLSVGAGVQYTPNPYGNKSAFDNYKMNLNYRF